MSNWLGLRMIHATTEKVTDGLEAFQEFDPDNMTPKQIETFEKTVRGVVGTHLALSNIASAGDSGIIGTVQGKVADIRQSARNAGRKTGEAITDATDPFRNPVNWVAKKYFDLDLDEIFEDGSFMDAIAENPLKAVAGAYVAKKLLGSDEGGSGFMDKFPTKMVGFLGVIALLAKIFVESAYAGARSSEEFTDAIAPLKNAMDSAFNMAGIETPKMLSEFFKMDQESIAKLSLKDAAGIAVESAKDIPDNKVQLVADGLADIIATADVLSPAEVDAKVAGVIGSIALTAAKVGKDVTDVLKEAGTQVVETASEKFGEIENVASATTTAKQADKSAELQHMLDVTVCNAATRHLGLSKEDAKRKLSSCAKLAAS